MKTEAEKLVQESKEILAKADELEASVKAKETETANKLSSSSSPVVGADSDEKRALRYFGVSHVTQLLRVNTADVRFKNVPSELKQLVLELKGTVDTARHIAQMFHGASTDHIGKVEEQDRIAHVGNITETYYGKNVLAPRLKSFSSVGSTAGAEWVPTLISANYVPEYELQFLAEGRMKQLALASSPYDLPIQTSVTKARKIAQSTGITDTNFATDKIRFTPIKSAEYYIMPEELNEDSAVDIMPVARDEVIRAQIRAWEAAIINGDDDGTHIDTDTQALGADIAEKFCKGLRRQALANSATTDFSNAAVTDANLRLMRSRMGKFGVDPSQLLWIVGPQLFTQFLSLPTVATVDKFGPMATILKGALAAYQGIPIIQSQYMREDVNASGIYTDGNVVRGALLLVNTTRWYVGTRRPIIVKMQVDLPSQDRWLMASYQRKDFQGHAQSASEKSVEYGINVAL